MKTIFIIIIYNFIPLASCAGICFYILRDSFVMRLRKILSYTAIFIFLYCLFLSFFATVDSDLTAYIITIMIYSAFLLGFWFLTRISSAGTGQILFVVLMVTGYSFFTRAIYWFVLPVIFGTGSLERYTYVDPLIKLCIEVFFTPFAAVFFSKFWKRVSPLKGLSWFRLSIIPAMFIVLYTVTSVYYLLFLDVEDIWLRCAGDTIISACSMVTYWQMSASLLNAAAAAGRTEEQRQLKYQLAVQADRMEEMAAHEDQMRRVRHDIRHHIRIVRDLLSLGKQTEAQNYLKGYEESIQNIAEPPLCMNDIADTICRRYRTLANSAGIRTSIEVNLEKEPGIASRDLSVLLGNLWENAVTAASAVKGPEKRISLSVWRRDGRLLFEMENTYSGRLREQDGNFASTKTTGDMGHGIGISSIRGIAEKYQGIAEFSYTENVFKVRVLLNMSILSALTHNKA